MNTQAPLLTADEVAEIVRQSPESVRRWAREGKIPSLTLPSGRIRFRRPDVEALLAGGPVESPSGAA